MSTCCDQGEQKISSRKGRDLGFWILGKGSPEAKKLVEFTRDRSLAEKEISWSIFFSERPPSAIAENP